MLIILFEVFVLKNRIAGHFREFFSYNRELASRIIRNALPTTANETLWGIGTSMYVAAFARIGISEGAAVQACNTINNMFALAAFSIGDAVLILVGQKLGEGKTELAYNMSRKMIRMGLIVGAVFGAGVIIAGEPLLSLFSFSEQGAAYAFRILIVYGATMWLTLYNAIHVDGNAALRGRYEIRDDDGNRHGVAYRRAAGVHHVAVSAYAYISGSAGSQDGRSSQGRIPD